MGLLNEIARYIYCVHMHIWMLSGTCKVILSCSKCDFCQDWSCSPWRSHFAVNQK